MCRGYGGQIANTGSHTLDSSTVSRKISASGSWTHLLFKSILLFKRKSPLHLLLKSILLFKRKSPLCPQDTRTLCVAVIGPPSKLPTTKNVGIFGYSTKKLTDQGLRSISEANLTCQVDHQSSHKRAGST